MKKVPRCSLGDRRKKHARVSSATFTEEARALLREPFYDLCSKHYMAAVRYGDPTFKKRPYRRKTK